MKVLGKNNALNFKNVYIKTWGLRLLHMSLSKYRLIVFQRYLSLLDWVCCTTITNPTAPSCRSLGVVLILRWFCFGFWKSLDEWRHGIYFLFINWIRLSLFYFIFHYYISIISAFNWAAAYWCTQNCLFCTLLQCENSGKILTLTQGLEELCSDKNYN